MKETTKKIIILLFLLMVVSGLSFGFIFSGSFSTSAVKKYKNLKFRYNPTNNIWIVGFKDREAAFSYLPEDTTSISVEGSPFNLLKSKVEIDTTSEANDTYKEEIALAQHQMNLVLSAYATFLRTGFTSENTFSLPAISCQDATQAVPVVYFVQSNSTKIRESNNCVIVELSDDSDAIRAKDRILYGILDVI